MKCNVRQTRKQDDNGRPLYFYKINCRPSDYVGRYASADAKMYRLRRDESICHIGWFGLLAQKHIDGYKTPFGQGFGKAAYSTFEEYLGDRGCKTLQLEPQDAEAEGFWRRMKYRCADEDCFRMVKYL